MRSEERPGEIAPVCNNDAVSGDVHGDDNFSDDEPENEIEALQHLPPEERRKALRRLRNRESARRVRARRLAEVSQMESAMRALKEENSALKSHVSKLQSHIQSMTLKVYEVTSKYESAVAENAQLRAELQRVRRPSLISETSLVAPPLSLAGPNSGRAQLSPFVSPEEGEGPAHLSAGHAQLRCSSPMDLQQQRQAVEEVVMLLKEHKRRNQMAAQDRSGGSEIGSTVIDNNTSGGPVNPHSPGSDVAMPGSMLPQIFSGEAGSGPFIASSLSYNGSGAGQMLGTVPALGPSGGSLTAGRRMSQMDAVMGRATPQPAALQQQQFQQPQQQQQQQQLSMMPHSVSAGPVCQLTMSGSQTSCQLPPLAQVQQLQQQLLAKQSGALGGMGGIGGYVHPQSLLMQSHSHPFGPLQPPQQQQQQQPFAGQQPLYLQSASGPNALGASSVFNTLPSFSAPFFSAVGAMPGGGGQQQQQPLQGNVASGPAAGMATCGHRSASFALDRSGGSLPFQAQAGGGGGVSMHHATWQGNYNTPGGVAGGTLGLEGMRQSDVPEDIFMSLDEYVPQDL